MSKETLPDQADRDAATKNHGESVFLAAGAGAGKTTTVIARILNALEDEALNLQIEQVVAITFTEKAGADLRHRLRRELLEKVEETGSVRLKAALDGLDSARVGTIHSFAQSILRQFAIEAQLPPGFEVLSDSESRRMSTQRMQEVINRNESLLGPDSYMRNFNISIKDLDDLLRDFNSLRLKIPAEAFADLAEPDTARFVSEYRSRAKRVYEELIASCINPADGLYPKIVEANKKVEAFLALEERAQITYLINLEKPETHFAGFGNSGSKNAWPQGPVQVRDEWKELVGEIPRLFMPRLEHTVLGFLAAASATFDELARDRYAKGQLEFDDLLSLTRDLLRCDVDVRAKLYQQHRFVMVDEFQDTDPVQWEIIKLVCSDPAVEGANPTPGRLTVVGDPKQAIFSFRGADIDTYTSAREEFSEWGTERTLSTNFRSVRSIIDWVNTTFKSAMTQDHQVPYEELAPNRGEIAARPSVTVLRSIDPESANKQTEAAHIAQTIQRAVAEGWIVKPDDKSDATRPAQFRDIAIIYPTRTSLDELLNAFEDRDIPYRAADSRLVLERPLVKGLTQLMRALNDPNDQLAIWSVLKTPVFGCTDSELLEFKKAGGNWSYVSPDSPAAGTRVGRALVQISDLRKNLRLGTPTAVFDGICEEMRLFEIAAISSRGSFDADCLQMVRGLAQQWEEQGGSGLTDFIDALDDLEEPNSRVTFSSPDDLEDDALRLMTIYGAKGLEFPIVAVGGMSAKRPTTKPALALTSTGKVEFGIGQGSSGWTEWLEVEYLPKVEAERMRLLYVACTRAQDYLILSQCLPKYQPGTSWAALLSQHVLPNPSDSTTEWNGAFPAAATPKAPTALAAEWSEKVIQATRRTSRPAIAFPSGNAAQALGVGLDVADVEPDIRESSSSEMSLMIRGGAALGQAVHAALDFLINSREPMSTTLIESAADAALLTAPGQVDRDALVAYMTRATESELFTQARAAENKWAELYLATPVEHEYLQMVEGFADLVFETSEGLVVVDYKTDRSPNEDTLAHYREQLRCYGELLNRATNKQVDKLFILHLSSENATAIEVQVSA